ncbi:MAG: DUF4845 domain-containing protein [Pseudomonadota bacterium]
MKTGTYQRGEGVWPVIFLLLLIGFVAYTVLKLFPVYMEDFSISSTMESIQEDQQKEYRGPISVREAILRRLRMNNVKRVGMNDVIVSRERGNYVATIDYKVVVPYIGNLSLMMEFSHTATVPAGI